VRGGRTRGRGRRRRKGACDGLIKLDGDPAVSFRGATAVTWLALPAAFYRHSVVTDFYFRKRFLVRAERGLKRGHGSRRQIAWFSRRYQRGSERRRKGTH